ncbi:heme ABC transporter substrate-binding protein IsdE [Paenibacillus sp. JCM 10914]|uniref:helical backbone metal receptor n=1 Tax=Paenibacillus sp. JCM 10914 TaxID=1236974 RepID=UPI0003CC41FD|nr:helical backbone metal receptor [Paenibacillus sp. JCM 10914]GAE08601.1 heme transporter IsdDEF, lipoprotein IsdE [Paenibacillus sp. JCM 10914]
MRNRLWKLSILVLSLMLLAACGNTTSSGSDEGTNQQVAAANTDSGTEAGSESGQETNEAGTEETEDASRNEQVDIPEVTVDEEKVSELLAQFSDKTPQTAVTLSVAITELYSALDLALAGVPTTQSQLPEAYADVERVGSSHQPDLEKIASLQPDTILAPASIKDSIGKMVEPAKLPAAYLPVDSLDELKASTVALGRLYGKEEQAQSVLQSFAKEEAEILKSVEGKAAPTVMFLFGSTEYLMLMNEDTFAGSLAKNLGASNVVADTLKSSETYVPFNMESVVQANPDVILLVAHGDANAVAKKFEEDVKKNGAWEKLKAFQNGKMQPLDYNLFGIASLTKAPEAYKSLASILYGE